MASWTAHRENSGVSSAGQYASAYRSQRPHLDGCCSSQWNHFGTRVPTAKQSGYECFRSGLLPGIQSLQHQSAPQTIDELIAAIGTAFSQLTRDKLNNIFLTLQSNLIETMKVNDGNNNKIPHKQKAHLDHINILPSRLECPRNIYDEATVALQQ
ncbi:hypothetical protein ANN_17301 [Periplaneta americana]|uniref:Uncharacterized protein n=1 Tax=Periplaneta americana TaxID=6978 RepID=A0ABQ8STR6_PERAM|nr:hypothetical protein ANN_17301 [Periplaneta americana]